MNNDAPEPCCKVPQMAQAVAMDDIDRIELSKENLQPLKRGRNPVILKSALGERAVGGGECSTGKGEDSILEQKRWAVDVA